MKNVFLPALFLLSLSVFGADIAPPSWIRGTWKMEFRGEVLELVFLEYDILMNGESLAAMSEAGYIISYQQVIDEKAFSLRVEYADGFWWMERFPRPSLNSSYTDKHYAGGMDNLFYTRIK